MSDQEDQPVTQAETVIRTSNGQFAPGSSGNPKGTPWTKGWQPYGKRLQDLANKYSPEEILNFAASPYARSKLSSFDAIAIMHLARTIDPDLTRTKAGTDDLRGERKELLDRIEGSPKATTELQGAGGSALFPTIRIVFEAEKDDNGFAPALNGPGSDLTIEGEAMAVEPDNTPLQPIVISFEED